MHILHTADFIFSAGQQLCLCSASHCQDITSNDL